MSHDLIFLENRRSPKVVKKGEKYTPKQSEGKITKRRAATAEEEKVISRGDWVRVNENGDKPGDSGYMKKKSKIRPQNNAGETDSFSFLETVASEYNRLVAWATFAGYEGVKVAGVAIVAADSGLVFMSQRTMDATDAPEVQESWEFPGGHLDGDETPWEAAMREFSEEITGIEFPTTGMVVNGWRSPDETYQGFVVYVETEFDTSAFVPNDEVQAVGWFSPDPLSVKVRPEVAAMDWSVLEPQQEDTMVASAAGLLGESAEPDLTLSDIAVHAIPVHGVLAPEDVKTGDGRGFNPGSMTSRAGRLPFMWQEKQTSGHNDSGVVGSVDRLMRKDGLIHWEGSLMGGGPFAGDFTEMLVFFGRFGVSVDGDSGSLDEGRSSDDGVAWFDAVRASGLTAVAIPAFAEAYVAFGPHPDMPPVDQGDALTASMITAGDLVTFGSTFDRGPGWVTHPVETNRIHDYWTKKGEPGYAKINWGTPGDFTRAKKLIGAKIAANSPEDMRYLNQIIAQWHHDALGYWPGELGKPGNAPDTAENRKRAAIHAATHAATHAGSDGESLADVDNDGIEVTTDEQGESSWEAVLVSSVSGNRVLPPLSYFHYQSDGGALHIDEPDDNGVQRVWGYAAQWGVCHVGFDGVCVEPPRTYTDDYPEFHLGRTKTDEGYITTGVLTYGVGHRDAQTILSESPDQAYYDNVNNAWAAVRVGEDEVGIWFSGVVLPGMSADHLVKIEASGQVSGEWKHGAMRACLTVNVPGFPVEQPSAVYDDNGNVMALAAAAYGGVESPCTPSAAETVAAYRAAYENAEAAELVAGLKSQMEV